MKINDIQYVRVLLTKRCNMSCSFCHQEGCAYSENDINFDLLMDTIKELYSIGYRKVKLMGGEPMLYKRIIDVVDAIKNIGQDMDVSMITNGSATVDSYLDLFNHGLDRLNVSVHGWNEDYFCSNTGGSSEQWHRVKSNIIELAKKGRINKINYVLIRGKNEDDFFNLLQDVKDLKIVVDVLNLLTFPGQEDAEKYKYTFDDIEEIIKKEWKIDESVNYENKFSLPSKRLTLHNGCVVNLKISQLNKQKIFSACKECEFRSLCVEGIKAIRITNDGLIQPCLLRNDNTLDLSKTDTRIVDYLLEL